MFLTCAAKRWKLMCAASLRKVAWLPFGLWSDPIFNKACRVMAVMLKHSIISMMLNDPHNSALIYVLRKGSDHVMIIMTLMRLHYDVCAIKRRIQALWAM